MREDEGFDLSSILAGLTDIANPYTEITILSVSQQLLHFRASKLVPAKSKQYKIIYSPEQAVGQLRKLVSGLKGFKTKKLVIGKGEPLKATLKDSLEQIKLTSLFEGVLFDEIRVQFCPQEPQTILPSLLNNFSTLKIAFLQPIHVKSIANLMFWLHSDLLSPELILSFQIELPTKTDLLDFAKHWVWSLTGPNNQKKQKYFGYPFPLPNKKQHYIGRREQISLVSDGRQIITARQMQEEGRFLVLPTVNDCKFACQLLQVLFLDQKGVSVQLGEFPSQDLVVLADFVSKNFERGYRLIIAHQLELSPCRIVLNTSGMSREEVEKMIRIAAEPGRYQIIFYSQLLYFQLAVKLFLRKPLIKFNFFLPFQSSTPELQALLSSIDHRCQNMKRYAYEYAALLSRYAGFGYIFVTSLFESLTYQP